MKLDSPIAVRLSQLRPVRKTDSLLGYIFECTHLSGWVRMKDLATELVDRQVIQPPWTVPTNLRGICEKLEPVFASAEQILEEHTCLPAHLPFVSLESKEIVLSHVMDGEKQMGVASLLGLAGRGIESKPEFALCPECLKEDQKEGAGAWRREHQLAGLGYCPHHGCPLLVGCGNCHFSQRGSRQMQLPHLRCKCGQKRALSHSAVSEDAGKVLTRMAQLGFQLLNGAMKDWSAREVTGYYHLKAKEFGYAFGGRFKTVALVEELRRRYSPAVLQRLNADLASDRNWLPLVFGKNGTSPVLGRNLLLLDFFGAGKLPEPEQLRQSSLYMAVWRPAKKGETRGQKEAPMQPSDKRLILEYIKAHPGAERSELLRDLGRVVTRVREHDPEWYRTVCPSKAAGRAASTEEERASYLQMLDKRTAAHVKKRLADLLSDRGRDPKMITKTALLKRAVRGNEISEELLKSLPKTRAAIEEAEETTAQYKERFALSILRLSRGDPHTLGRAQVRTGLRRTHVNQLNAKVLAEEVDAAGRKSLEGTGEGSNDGPNDGPNAGAKLDNGGRRNQRRGRK